jgi:hypothetical protein
MIILDENIPARQREPLEGWHIRTRQIGIDVARKGIQDDEIIPYLQHHHNPTFVIRDQGFFNPRNAHTRYYIVVMACASKEVASLLRRFLQHPKFQSAASRMGLVL